MKTALAATLLAFASVGASAGPARLDNAAGFARDFAAVQQLDARVHALGWGLRTGNATYCPDIAFDTGLLLQDARSYASAELLRAHLSLKGDIFVQAVAPASPAEQAGLGPHDVVLAIDGQAMSAVPWSDTEPWARLSKIERMANILDQDARPIVMAVAGGGGSRPIPTAATCRTRFELVSSGDSMGADGARVRIGRGFPGFAYPDDELAAALAHELAHNILRHPQWLAAHGRKRRDVRASEREADRLMPWLLANAGHDPAAAARFMRRWGPKHNGGLLRKRTHDGWDERVELIEAELPLIAAAQRETGQADWRERFRPRPLP